QHYEQPVFESGQVIDMDDEPRRPGYPSGEFDLPDFQHRSTAADRRHLSFVDKMKRPAMPAMQISKYRLRDVSTLLHRDGGGTRQRPAGLLRESCLIAGNKHVGLTFNSEVRFDDDAPLRIGFQAGNLAEGRSANARRP